MKAQRLHYVFITVLFILGSLLGPVAQVSAGSGDNYPWKAQTNWEQCQSDDWQYCQRWCTSWVAWALHDRNDFEIPSGLGSAKNWCGWARDNGYDVDMSPKVGSVA